MKISKKLMLKLMKEEYDKRVKYFLGEIEVKDSKRDVNLIKDAIGLKVRNKQGLELTVEDFVVIDNIEYIVLRPPELPRAGVDNSENEELKSLEFKEAISESESETLQGLDRDLRSKSSKMDYKRSFKNFDAENDLIKKSDIKDGLVYVKITDFESEYSL